MQSAVFNSSGDVVFPDCRRRCYKMEWKGANPLYCWYTTRGKERWVCTVTPAPHTPNSLSTLLLSYCGTENILSYLWICFGRHKPAISILIQSRLCGIQLVSVVGEGGLLQAWASCEIFEISCTMLVTPAVDANIRFKLWRVLHNVSFSLGRSGVFSCCGSELLFVYPTTKRDRDSASGPCSDCRNRRCFGSMVNAKNRFWMLPLFFYISAFWL